MIKIEKTYKGILRITSFTCPYCDEENTYVGQVQKHCDICGLGLPNIKSLMESEIDRIMYHRTGKTVSERR